MQKQYVPARAFSLFALASLLLAGVPVLPFFAGTAQAAPPLFQETWDTGGLGWTTTPGLRIGVDPTVSFSPPASLVVDAQTSGQTLKTERDLALSFADAPGYVVSFVFRNEFSQSESTSWFMLKFPGGGHIKLDPTSTADHNKVRLYTNQTGTMPFFTYQDKTWYEARIKVDLVAGNARAEIWNPLNNTRLANSSSIPVYASAKSVGLVSFEGTYSGNDPLGTQEPWPMNFDNFQVRLPDPPAAPSLSAAAGPGLGEVSLSWAPNDDDGGAPLRYYHVYRGNDTGSVTTLIANTTARSFTDTGLGNGTTRFYVVKAANAMGLGASSGQVQVTTFAAPTAPGGLVTLPGPGVGEIRLTWQAPANLGGKPVTNYTIYRGASFGNETILTTLGNATIFTDTHRAHNTTWYYKIAAVNLVGEGPKSDGSASKPRPDHAAAPHSVQLTPFGAWSGDERNLTFSYEVTSSQCEPNQTCPTVNEWRVYMDGSLDGADGTLLANGTNLHQGHAEKTRYDVVTVIPPQGEVGLHRMKVAVTPRQGANATWNVSTVEFRIESLTPGSLTGPTTPILNRTTVPNGGEVSLTSAYTVFQNQCALSQSCPMPNDWRILLRGGQINHVGALITKGTNVHPAHGTNETYTIHQNLTLPEVDAGAYELVVAARLGPNAPWQETTAPITVEVCSPVTQLHRFVRDENELPTGLARYSRNFTYVTPVGETGGPVSFYNTCPNSAIDQVFELGIGGALIDVTHFAGHIHVVDDSGLTRRFYVGSDMDLSGIVGDSALDCLEGPFTISAEVVCPPDIQGNVIVFLTPDFVPKSLWFDGPPGPGSIRYCRPEVCKHERPPEQNDPQPSDPNPYYQADNDDYDGYGDAWTRLRTKFDDIKRIVDNLASDHDQDGLSNLDEFRWDTIAIAPLPAGDPTRNLNARDFDADDWMDGPEHIYWNDVNNDQGDQVSALWTTMGYALTDPDSRLDHWNDGPDGDQDTTLRDPDVDGDGLKDGREFQNGTYPDKRESSCSFNASIPDRSGANYRCDGPANWYGAGGKTGVNGTWAEGDGMLDPEEVVAWLTTPVANAMRTDFDNDGIAHNVMDPDADDDGISDGDEFRGLTPNLHAQSAASSGRAVVRTDAYEYDTDRDFLLDGPDVTVGPGDSRWHLFDGKITYITLEDGDRRYLGEQSQRTNPKLKNSDGQGGMDGENIPGANSPSPSSQTRRAYEDVAPNSELSQSDVSADAWDELHDDTTSVSQMFEPVGPAVYDIVQDPWTFINNTVDNSTFEYDNFVPEFLSHVTALQENVTEGAECAVKSLPSIPPGSTMPDPEAPVDCVLGVVETILPTALSALNSTPLSQLTPLLAFTGINPLDPMSLTNLTFVEPVLEKVLSKTFVNDTLFMGEQTDPYVPWNTSKPKPTPWDPILYGDMEYPAFISSTLQSQAGLLYDIINEKDKEFSASLMGTLDSGTYTIAIWDETAKRYCHTANVSLGSAALLDIQDPCNRATLTPDILVRADYAINDPLVQAPQLTLQKLGVGSVPLDPLYIEVVVFLQIPGADSVVALGGNYTKAALGSSSLGLPSSVQFSLGTNAIVRSLNVDGQFTFIAKSGNANTPARLGASYFNVTENSLPKRPIASERADLSVTFPAAPAHAKATITVPANNTGFTLEWEATSEAKVSAGVRVAHQTSYQVVTVSGDTLPASFKTKFNKTETRVMGVPKTELMLQHDASGQVGQLVAAWNLTSSTKSYLGGVNASRIPKVATIVYNELLSKASYSGSEALGNTTFFAAEESKGATSDPPCRRASYSYIIHVADGTGVCTNVRLYEDLESMSVAWPDAISFAATRTKLGKAILAHVDVPGLYIDLTTSSWPTLMDFRFAKTNTSLRVDGNVSTLVKAADLVYQSGGTSAVVSVRDVPPTYTFTADYPSSTINATATLGGMITDLNVQYTRDRSRAPVGLGDDDGVILKSVGGEMSDVAVRLRDFSGADLHASPTTGLDLTTDSASTKPFHVRYENGPLLGATATEWLSVELPQLPKRVTVTYNKTDAAMDFRYHSSEVLKGLGGHLKVSDGKAGIYAKVSDFPKSLEVEADFILNTFKAVASSPVVEAEVALTGPTNEYPNVPWKNYVLIDHLNPVELDGRLLPQFHIKNNGLLNVTGSLASGDVRLDSKFNGTPGDFAVRYRDAKGWLDLNVTSNLPPMVSARLNRSGLEWHTTEGYNFSADGAGQLEGFNGRFNLRGIPSHLSASWTRATGIFNASVNHSAAKVPLIDVTVSVNLTPQSPASLIRVYAENLPTGLNVTVNSYTGRYEVRATDAQGKLTTSGKLEAAYVDDATKGLPHQATLTGAVAYAKLNEGQPAEFFGRLGPVSNLVVQAKPDPQHGGDMWMTYKGTGGGPLTLDVSNTPASADEAPTLLRASLSNVPASLDAALYFADGGTMIMDSTSSETITAWEVDWRAQGNVMRGSGSLPKKLHAEKVGGAIRFDSYEEPTDIFVSVAPQGKELVPEGYEGDFAVARLSDPQVRFAVRLTDLTWLNFQPATGWYEIGRNVTRDTYLDVVFTDHSRLVGSIDDMAPYVFLEILPGSDTVRWNAEGTTTGIDIEGWRDGKVWRVNATGVPSHFNAVIEPTVGRFGLTTAPNAFTPGGAFTSLDLAYVGEYPFNIPRIDDTQGFMVDLGPAEDPQKARVALKVQNLKSLSLTRGTDLVVDIKRSTSGGDMRGAFRTSGDSADVFLTSLTKELTVTFSEANVTQGLRLRIDGHGLMLGSARATYVGHLGNAAVYFVNLPKSIDLTLDKGTGTRLHYEAPAVASVPTKLYGTLITNDGYQARFTVTELPGELEAYADTANGTVYVNATGGVLSGTIYAGKVGGRVYVPPTGYSGASVSLDPANFHTWINVNGLKRVMYEHDPLGTDHVVLEHGWSQPAFFVHGEDAQRDASVSMIDMPSLVSVNLTREVNRTTFAYDASGTSTRAYAEAATKGKTNDNAWVQMFDVPSSVHLRVENGSGPTSEVIKAKLNHTGDDTPDIYLGFRSADSRANGTLLGVPSSVEVTIDPTVDGKETLGCAFNMESSGTFNWVKLSLGRGGRSTDPWTDAADQYLRIVARSKAPDVDLKLYGVGDAKFCQEKKEDFQLVVDLGAKSLTRVLYRALHGEKLEVELSGTSAGTYTVEKAAGLIHYNAPGTVSGLHVRSNIRFKEALFNKEVTLLSLDASGVPADIKVDSQGTKLDVASSGEVTDLYLKMQLAAPPQTQDGAVAQVAPPKDFLIDIDEFDAAHLKVDISYMQVPWPTDSRNDVLFNARESFLGLDLYDVHAGEVEFVNGAFFEVRRIQLDPGEVFRAHVGLPPDVPVKDITIVIKDMPSTLTAKVDFPGDGLLGIFTLGASVTPSNKVTKFIASLGPSETSGKVITIYDIPAGSTVSISDLVATALSSVVLDTAGDTIGGFSYTIAEDATHWKRYNFGRIASLQMYADMDRAQNAPGRPWWHYMDFTGGQEDAFTVDYMNGDFAYKMHGELPAALDSVEWVITEGIGAGIEAGIDVAENVWLYWNWQAVIQTQHDFSSLMRPAMT